MTNLKALMERREELRQNMETLVSTADTECRAMTEEEAAQFDAAENELMTRPETARRQMWIELCSSRFWRRSLAP